MTTDQARQAYLRGEISRLGSIVEAARLTGLRSLSPIPVVEPVHSRRSGVLAPRFGEPFFAPVNCCVRPAIAQPMSDPARIAMQEAS